MNSLIIVLLILGAAKTDLQKICDCAMTYVWTMLAYAVAMIISYVASRILHQALKLQKIFPKPPAYLICSSRLELQEIVSSRGLWSSCNVERFFPGGGGWIMDSTSREGN